MNFHGPLELSILWSNSFWCNMHGRPNTPIIYVKEQVSHRRSSWKLRTLAFMARTIMALLKSFFTQSKGNIQPFTWVTKYFMYLDYFLRNGSPKCEVYETIYQDRGSCFVYILLVGVMRFCLRKKEQRTGRFVPASIHPPPGLMLTLGRQCSSTSYINSSASKQLKFTHKRYDIDNSW